MTLFSDLSLDPLVLKAIAETGYETPTPIQAAAIPPALERRDVMGIAQTGTGKTASFTLPLITRLIRGRARARMPRSLVLAPTRELAAQVAENFDAYAKYTKLTKALLIGGVSFGEQDKIIDRGVDVLIATPGRLLDHFERGKLLLTGVEVMVVDEADRMLDMGFIPDIERIFNLTPANRQTLFFSATMAPEIERITNQFLANAVKVEVARQATTSDTIEQALIKFTPSRKEKTFLEKRDLLRRLIRQEGESCTNAIIFCNRKIDVDVVAKSLKSHGFDAAPIHGDLDQSHRTRTLEGFREGTLRFLVASDVAARGLDIPAVSHVFNFDVPSHAEDYVHRIGRTGRAGRKGKAFTIAVPADEKYLAAIEHMVQKPLPLGEAPEGFVPGSREERPEGGNRRNRGGEDEGQERGASRRGGRRERGKPRSEAPKAEQAVSVKPEAELVEAVAEAPRKREAQAEEPSRQEARHEHRHEGKHEHRHEHRSEARSDSRGDNRNDRDRRDRNGRRDDKPVVGMGDHMPNFLLRPFRLNSGN